MINKTMSRIKQLAKPNRERITLSGELRNSKAYACTIDLTNENDLDILTKIRNLVSDHNLYNRSGKKLVVNTKTVKQFGTNARDKHRNLIGGLDNSRLIDVYIY